MGQVVDQELKEPKGAPKAVVITDELATELAAACELEASKIFRDRELTGPEVLFFKIGAAVEPKLTILADLTLGKSTLLVYEQDLGKSKKKDYLAGTRVGDPKDALEAVEDIWAAITVARSGSIKERIGQDLFVVFTGWKDEMPARRFSFSISPAYIRGVYTDAPRLVLLEAEVGELPPKVEGDKKIPQGMGLIACGTKTVLFVHAIYFQGARTLLHYDAKALRQMVLEEAAASMPPHTH